MWFQYRSLFRYCEAYSEKYKGDFKNNRFKGTFFHHRTQYDVTTVVKCILPFQGILP